jgi:hypothetical protein
MGDVGDRFVMDLEGCGPEIECRGREVRVALDSVLFECWSSVANLARCVALDFSGDLGLPPFSLAALPARGEELDAC